MAGSSKREIWKSIKSYRYYEVSNLGRVRSINRYRKCGYGKKALCRGQVLKPHPMKIGYHRIQLYKGGDRRRTEHYLHILVARHFVPNPKRLPEVNHKDLNKRRSVASNLEWTKHVGNMQHAARAGTNAAATNPKRAIKLTAKKVERILVMRSRGKLQREVAARFGVSRSMISMIENGHSWQPYGLRT